MTSKKERAQADKFFVQGYQYGIQFVNSDGSKFGAPFYFRDYDAIGVFVRDNPDLTQKWIITNQHK